MPRLAGSDARQLLEDIFEQLLRNKLLPEGAHNRRKETLDVIQDALEEMNGGEIDEKFLNSPKAIKTIIAKTFTLAHMPKNEFDALMDLYAGKSLEEINEKDLKNGLKRIFTNIVKDEELDDYVDKLYNQFKLLEQENGDEGLKNGAKTLMSNALVMQFRCMAIPDEIGASQEQTYINKGLNPAIVVRHATSPNDLTQGDPTGQVAQALQAVEAQGSEPGPLVDEMVSKGIISREHPTPKLVR